MWRGIFIIVGLCASAAPSLAANRFYCAADDANIKLSLDVGFSDDPGQKLDHFRGALISKSAEVPAGFKALMLDSGQLTQTWSHDGDLRLAIAALGASGDAAKSFDLVVMAKGGNEAAPMSGSYELAFDMPNRTQPLQLTGRLTCNAK